MCNLKLDYRVLWTWDYCVFWDDSYFVRGYGATGENNRRTYFLNDYKRMVDYCATLGINGIVIWGALRAHDDGLTQFKELVKYGRLKGVRIMPGVGVFGYGGVLFDPRENLNFINEFPADSPYFLPTWLKKHPELAAIRSDGKPYSMGMYSAVACPSKKENLEWFKNSFQWLCDEFQIDGAQIEVGDYAVCHCDDCKKRRIGASDAPFMIEDMVEPYTAAYDIAKKMNPDFWAICETYSSYAIPKTTDKPNHFGSALNEQKKMQLSALPSDAIAQWVLDCAVPFKPTQDWPEKANLPLKNNISRIHHGSQWSVNSIDEWAVYEIADMVKNSRSCGVNGVSIFGEESPASPPNEANYLIFSEFSGYGNPNPECDLKTFYKNTLDPLYGGAGFAEEWRRIYITAHTIRLNTGKLNEKILSTPLSFHHNYFEIDKPDLLKNVLNMSSDDKQKETVRLAKEAHDISSKMSGEVCRRWSWLENWLWRAEFLHRTNI